MYSQYSELLKNKFIIPAGVAVSVIILLAGGYFFYQNKQPKTDPNNPQANQEAAQAEVKKFVSEVGKLMDLPTGEDPTIATVTDIEKLKDQPFFQKAKNGDKVLIYANARKAILYDPVLRKILDVVVINTGSPSASPSALPK